MKQLDLADAKFVLGRSLMELNRMQIAQAQSVNEPEIRLCARQAYAHYIPRIGKEPAPINADYSSMIADGSVYIGIDDTKRMIGFIVFYKDAGSMFIENVAILPSFQGHGFGKRLIAFCEQEARQQNIFKVSLYTNEKMTENVAMYQKMGYLEVGRRHEDGFNRVFFEKLL